MVGSVNKVYHIHSSVVRKVLHSCEILLIMKGNLGKGIWELWEFYTVCLIFCTHETFLINKINFLKWGFNIYFPILSRGLKMLRGAGLAPSNYTVAFHLFSITELPRAPAVPPSPTYTLKWRWERLLSWWWSHLELFTFNDWTLWPFPHKCSYVSPVNTVLVIFSYYVNLVYFS